MVNFFRSRIVDGRCQGLIFKWFEMMINLDGLTTWFIFGWQIELVGKGDGLITRVYRGLIVGTVMAMIASSFGC